jgi:hypothetical protein
MPRQPPSNARPALLRGPVSHHPKRQPQGSGGRIVQKPAIASDLSPAASLFEFWNVPGIEERGRRLRALCHHLRQVPIRQPIGDLPTHAHLGDVGIEHSLAIHPVTGNPTPPIYRTPLNTTTARIAEEFYRKLLLQN